MPASSRLFGHSGDDRWDLDGNFSSVVLLAGPATHEKVKSDLLERFQKYEMRVMDEGGSFIQGFMSLMKKYLASLGRFSRSPTLVEDILELARGDASISRNFLVHFGVPLSQVAEEGRLLSAESALKLRGGTMTPKRLRSYAETEKTIELCHNLFVTFLPQDDVYVVNSFCPEMCVKLDQGLPIYWYSIIWRESSFSMEDFLVKVIGLPHNLEQGSLLWRISEEWDILGLPEKPESNFGIVVPSSGGLEALSHRSALGIPPVFHIESLSKKVICHGINLNYLLYLESDPLWPSLGPHTHRGLTFDNTYGLTDENTLDWMQNAQGIEWMRLASRLIPFQTALILVLPFVNTAETRDMITSELQANDITIESSGEMTWKEIIECEATDGHFYRLMKYAMRITPKHLILPDDAQRLFYNFFKTSWSTEIAAQRVLNANEACILLGKLNSTELLSLWEMNSHQCVKLLPDFYITKLEKQEYYVINGFYPSLRECFLAGGTTLQWYTVGFDEKNLSWKSFISDVIGSSDKKNRCTSSIRAIMRYRWVQLGLTKEPDTWESGIYVSEGPLQAIWDKIIWLNSPFEQDPFVQICEKADIPTVLLRRWRFNTIETNNGISRPIFEITKEYSSSQLIKKLCEENVNLLKELIKPMRCSSMVIILRISNDVVFSQLIENFFREKGVTVDDINYINMYEVEKRSLYKDLRKDAYGLALEVNPEDIFFTSENELSFFDTFGEAWKDVISSRRILNAKQALSKLSDMTPAGLTILWEKGKLLEIDSAFTIGYFAHIDFYIINGHMPGILDLMQHSGGKGFSVFSVSWEEIKFDRDYFLTNVIGKDINSKSRSNTLQHILLSEISEFRALKQASLVLLSIGVFCCLDVLKMAMIKKDWFNQESFDCDHFITSAYLLGINEGVLLRQLNLKATTIFSSKTSIGKAASHPWSINWGTHERSFHQISSSSNVSVLRYLWECAREAKLTLDFNSALVTICTNNKDLLCQAEMLINQYILDHSVILFEKGYFPGGVSSTTNLMNHYFISEYYYSCEALPGEYTLSNSALLKFELTFHIPWKIAVNAGTVINAQQAINRYGVSRFTDLIAASVFFIDLLPDLRIDVLPGENLLVVNGYYPILRDRFTDINGGVYYYVFSWDDADMTWLQFKMLFESDMLEFKFNHTCRMLPSSENPFHLTGLLNISCGSIHAFVDRMNFLQKTLEEDPFGWTALQMGIEPRILTEILNGYKSCSLKAKELLDSDNNKSTKEAIESLRKIQDMEHRKNSMRLHQSITKYDDAALSPRYYSEPCVPPDLSSFISFSLVSVPHSLSQFPPPCINRQYAFVVLLPVSNTPGGQNIANLFWHRLGIQVEAEGDISSKNIRKRRLLEKSFPYVSRYAVQLKPWEYRLPLTSQKIFEGAFDIDWNTAVNSGFVFNALDALHVKDITTKRLLQGSIASRRRARLQNGLTIVDMRDTLESESPFYVVNPEYPDLLLTLCGKDGNIHWFSLSWESSQLSYADFVSVVYSRFSPLPSISKTLKQHLSQISVDWGPRHLPDALKGGIIISNSPLEAMVFRRVWMDQYEEARDPLLQIIQYHNLSTQYLLYWSTNPMIQIPPSTTDRAAFDVFYLCEVSDIISALEIVGKNDDKHIELQNTAVIIIAPDLAQTSTENAIKNILEHHNIQILSEKCLETSVISEHILATYFQEIIFYANVESPHNIVPNLSGLADFYAIFHQRWEDVLRENLVYNVTTACSLLSKDPLYICSQWSCCRMVQLNDFVSVGELKEFGIFVVNGFYPELRKKFSQSNGHAYVAVVQWNVNDLSYNQFLREVIGNRCSSKAFSGSIRNMLHKKGMELGLQNSPDPFSNSIFVSHGPLEAIRDQSLWFNTPLEDLLIVKKICKLSINIHTLKMWVKNSYLQFYPPSSFHLPAISYFRGLNFRELLDALYYACDGASLDISEIENLSWEVAKYKNRSPSQFLLLTYHYPSRTDGVAHYCPPFLKLSDREVFRQTNVAFLCLKPYISTSDVICLLRDTFEKFGISIRLEGSLDVEDVIQRNCVDNHFFRLYYWSNIDFDDSPIQLSEREELLFDTMFPVSWSNVLMNHGYIGSFAALKRFNLSPRELANLCQKSSSGYVMFRKGLYMSFISKFSFVVINGYYPAQRELFHYPASGHVSWWVISWSETYLSWRRLVDEVLGIKMDDMSSLVSPQHMEEDDAQILEEDIEAIPKSYTDSESGDDIGSLVSTIVNHWYRLGLEREPESWDTFLYCSQNPLEAVAERCVWIPEHKIEYDWYSYLLLSYGVTNYQLTNWVLRALFDLNVEDNRHIISESLSYDGIIDETLVINFPLERFLNASEVLNCLIDDSSNLEELMEKKNYHITHSENIHLERPIGPIVQPLTKSRDSDGFEVERLWTLIDRNNKGFVTKEVVVKAFDVYYLLCDKPVFFLKANFSEFCGKLDLTTFKNYVGITNT